MSSDKDRVVKNITSNDKDKTHSIKYHFSVALGAVSLSQYSVQSADGLMGRYAVSPESLTLLRRVFP